MSEPFIGQIIEAGWGFAAQGYATCDGQLMSIQQNAALFSLLGTTFGGNGVQTFGLPDLRGRVPMHQGQGPGLTPRVMGEMSGTENVSVISNQLPSHNHLVKALSTNGSVKTPASNVYAFVEGVSDNIYSAAASNTQMNAAMIAPSGGNVPHNNTQPYLVTNFQIALQGVFPSRS